MDKPTLAGLAGVFFRAGNFTLGGGGPTIAVLYREIVDRRRWLTLDDHGASYGLSRVTPGTNVLAYSASMAFRMAGTLGAIAAVSAASGPSAIVVTLMVTGFDKWQRVSWVHAALEGAMAAVIALICYSAWKLLRPFLTPTTGVRAALTAAIAGVLVGLNTLPPVGALALAGVAGWLLPIAVEQ